MSPCPHCGSEVLPGNRHAPWCCAGCREVQRLIEREGLERFYALGGGDGVPARESSARPSAWLEPLVQEAEERGTQVCRLELDVQGVHCAGCVWLMNELFKRRPGAAAITVNPSLGKVRLAWQRGAFDTGAFVESVERFGYRFGPSRKEARSGSRDLPLRIGICVALTMNVMIFTVAFYTGLAPSDGALFDLFGQLSMWLSVGVVAVGGWPFFKAAYEGLRRGVLHLDLPIAFGILLAFGTSLVQAQGGRGDLAYFDTLDTFVTLMLVGRWLQERLLHRNRRFLLDDAGADGLHVRVKEGTRLGVTTAPGVRADDVLVIAPGDLVPVDAILETDTGSFSTDWIDGESTPHRLERGATVPAGSFNAGRSAVELRAKTGFAASPLPQLLRAPHNADASPRMGLIQKWARLYVPAVFVVSIAGFLLWLPHGVSTALDVMVALLVVTCPCALGIAVPLAQELALADLRRSGVFVRAADLLERALSVRRVLFDKTGTLTLGRLELVDESPLDDLDEKSLRVLHAMTGASNHPASRAIADALRERGVPFEPLGESIETPGEGLELVVTGRAYRVGRASWAGGGEGTVFSEGGRPLASFRLREALRQDASREIARLEAEGVQAWLVSGDSPERVEATAKALRLPPERALAGCRPEDKAALVDRLGREDTLFVGDGVNDSLAFSRAGCTGTPAIDRPVMPSKADFFLLGEGTKGVREVLSSARRLRRAVKLILLVAVTYNVLAVLFSLVGLMTPLRAAIAMPLSSVLLIALTVTWMGARKTGSDAQLLRPAEAS